MNRKSRYILGLFVAAGLSLLTPGAQSFSATTGKNAPSKIADTVLPRFDEVRKITNVARVSMQKASLSEDKALKCLEGSPNSNSCGIDLTLILNQASGTVDAYEKMCDLLANTDGAQQANAELMKSVVLCSLVSVYLKGLESRMDHEATRRLHMPVMPISALPMIAPPPP